MIFYDYSCNNDHFCVIFTKGHCSPISIEISKQNKQFFKDPKTYIEKVFGGICFICDETESDDNTVNSICSICNYSICDSCQVKITLCRQMTGDGGISIQKCPQCRNITILILRFKANHEVERQVFPFLLMRQLIQTWDKDKGENEIAWIMERLCLQDVNSVNFIYTISKLIEEGGPPQTE